MPRSPLSLAACALASLALLAGCGGDDGEAPATGTTPSTIGFDAVVGGWRGTLSQAGTKPFPISVRIESEDDPSRNVVRYGGEIDCSGTWGLVGDTGGEVIFREVIDRGGGGRCKGVGTVRLTPTDDADRLDYEFRGGGVESEGQLSRRG